MTWVQVLTPNPTVPCTPGWCLKYVSDAFGVSNIQHTNYASATDAWNASAQHYDQSFPAGLWVPVWFSLSGVPEGHVALRAPDGSVWSSSDPNTNVPHHHLSLAALIAYYAKANPLTYLGWSEDIGGTAVIKQQGEDIMDADDVKELYRTALHREPESDAVVQGRVGMKAGVALAQVRDSQEWLHQNHEVVYFDQTLADLTTTKAALVAEQAKSTGLAKNLNDSQLELKDAQEQLAQAESIASDDDAKIKALTAQLAAANSKVVALAEKPPAPSTSTSTSIPPFTAPQPQPTQTPWLDSLLRYLRIK